jgi:hypothetical protein
VAPGLQTHGQRVANRNSTHSYALDNTFRFIDGMTKGRAGLPWRVVAKPCDPVRRLLTHESISLRFVIPSRGTCGSTDLSWKCFRFWVLLRGGGRRACGMSHRGLCRHIRGRKRPCISRETLVGMVGNGYLHKTHPQWKGGVTAAFFLAD